MTDRQMFKLVDANTVPSADVGCGGVGEGVEGAVNTTVVGDGVGVEPGAIY